MHYTLHMTAGCNMRCDYCYVQQSPVIMTPDTAHRVVDIALQSGEKKLGIIFFGGEPLLCRSLIEYTVSYARKMSKDTDSKFYFKITTNGLLLDEAFLALSMREDIFIALSIDGIPQAHNAHRVDVNGSGTYKSVEAAAKMLLAQRPYSPAFMTVNPDTVDYYAQSVQHLYDLGFKFLVCSLNYAAKWKEKDFVALKRQYKLLADFYYENTMAENKFYLSPFEAKISSHINNRTYCHERCELGLRQVSVGPDGTIYPCIQFVGDSRYAIGDVISGIDGERRQSLFAQNETEKQECGICAIRKRCNHYCACLNKQATGTIDEVSPVLCAHERIILPIADRLAERLYKNRSEMFIQKQYNDFYSFVSLVEDKV